MEEDRGQENVEEIVVVRHRRGSEQASMITVEEKDPATKGTTVLQYVIVAVEDVGGGDDAEAGGSWRIVGGGNDIEGNIVIDFLWHMNLQLQSREVTVFSQTEELQYFVVVVDEVVGGQLEAGVSGKDSSEDKQSVVIVVEDVGGQDIVEEIVTDVNRH